MENSAPPVSDFLHGNPQIIIKKKMIGNGKSPNQGIKLTNLFQSGFLAEYFSYAEPLTDAPTQFHIPIALCTLSTVVGNNIFLQIGDKRLYPNIWALILAPSSTHRKSSSIQIGLNLIRQVDRSLVLPNEFSIESFLEHLALQSQGILSYSEFSSLLEVCQRSYMIGLKSILADLYDCRPWFTRKLKKSEFTIENGCLSLIGASTIDWLIEGLREGDIRGGFMARFLYFPSSEKTKSLPIPPKADELQKQELVRNLVELRQIKGEMELSKEARACFEDWYVQNEKDLVGEVRSDLLSSFFNRLPDYCWKIAMLYTVLVHGDLTISGEAVSRAIALIEYLKSSIRRLVDEEFEFTEEGRNKKKLYRIIKDHASRNFPIDHSTLLRNSHIPARKFKEAINTLYEEGKLLPSNGDGRYCPAG